MVTSAKHKRNRVAINVEDVIMEALINLAAKEGVTVSELGRDMLVSELSRLGLLPDASLRRLAGVRD